MKTGLGLKRKAKNSINTIRVTGKQKIFCIGFNKTGTTSLETEMRQNGFIVGSQGQAMRMIDSWALRNFKPIINLCRTAQFFQDVPFSYPYTYIVLDQYFKGSKFILTIRDNPEQWYDSLITFHEKLWGNGKKPISAEELKKAPGLWPGFRFHAAMMKYNVPENDPYNKDILIDYYKSHIKNVRDYFRHRSEDLLVINLKEKDSYSRFCKFIDIPQKKDTFPWENKTSEK